MTVAIFLFKFNKYFYFVDIQKKLCYYEITEIKNRGAISKSIYCFKSFAKGNMIEKGAVAEGVRGESTSW